LDLTPFSSSKATQGAKTCVSSKSPGQPSASTGPSVSRSHRCGE